MSDPFSPALTPPPEPSGGLSTLTVRTGGRESAPQMTALLKLLESCTGPSKLALYQQDGIFWQRRGELKVTQKLIEELRAAVNRSSSDVA